MKICSVRVSSLPVWWCHSKIIPNNRVLLRCAEIATCGTAPYLLIFTAITTLLLAVLQTNEEPFRNRLVEMRNHLVELNNKLAALLFQPSSISKLAQWISMHSPRTWTWNTELFSAFIWFSLYLIDEFFSVPWNNEDYITQVSEIESSSIKKISGVQQDRVLHFGFSV